MLKRLRFSQIISCVLVVAVVVGLAVEWFQAMDRPVLSRPEGMEQLVTLKPEAAAEEGADWVYEQTLQTYPWSHPACAVVAARNPFSVYLDGELLYAYTPGTYEHGGMIHWISLNQGDLSGREFTVTSTSGNLSVMLGDYGDLMLHYRNANIPALVFSSAFVLLGLLIWMISLGSKVAIGSQKCWTLRYLGWLVMVVGIWVSTDAAVFQLFGGYGALMYLLAQYSFMAMPFFLLQFYRSLMAGQDRLLWLLSRLHLLDLALSGVLQSLGVIQLHQILPVTHILTVVTLVSLLRYLVSRLHSEFRLEAVVMLTGFGVLGVCCAVGFADYYLWEKTWYLLCISVGVLFFVASLVAVSMGYVYREMVKSSRMRYYQQLADTDRMTRMGSRTAFEERMRKIPVLEGSCACLVMDINNLKQINDTMGHLAGDELICDAAACILSVFEPLGSCYRMGGDEFMVLLTQVTEGQVRSALNELEVSINRKNLTRPFPLAVAVGYAMGEDADVEELFGRADEAMYQNKRRMKSKVG